jgi:molybdate-binding protein
MVARGNPLRINPGGPWPSPGVRYINCATGTGTRVLPDELLSIAGMTPRAERIRHL